MENRRFQPEPIQEDTDHPAMIIKQILGDNETLHTLVHTTNSKIRSQVKKDISNLELQESASLAKNLMSGIAKDTNKTRRRGAEILLKQINFDGVDPQLLKNAYIDAIENQDTTPNTGIDYALQRVGKIIASHLPGGPDTQKEIRYAWNQARPNYDQEIAHLRKEGLLAHEIEEQQGIVFSTADMKAVRERFRRKGETLQPLTRGGLQSKIDERRKKAAELSDQGFSPKKIAEMLGERRDRIRKDLSLRNKRAQSNQS